MQIINCPNKCCSLKYIEYIPNQQPFITVKRSHRKAGIFITEPTGKILLVQSKGNLWGCPKGTMKKTESSEECAIRETKEETGLEISIEKLKSATRFDIYHNKATYYSLTIPYQEVNIQDDIQENDANGIGWIKPECLKEMVETEKIAINQHCRIVIEKFLRISIKTQNLRDKLLNLNLGTSFPKFLKNDSDPEENSDWNTSLSCSPITY
jgi:ADP-ribose pyrophosphatase YjhB (NUDIX family)